ncbi:MAG: patatin-like phospholipase family protein [Nitrosopumilus sp.]|nr:patatin-like phospholipase family protein [Nitrosopumilus sp.]
MANNILDKQRALVLQGGAALGAYEAGVYRVFYDWIYKEIKDKENVFDILAGTSIGSINSAILLSYVLKRKKDIENISNKESWKGSAEMLENFWTEDTSTLTTVESSLFEHWWNFTYGLVPNAATTEAARRHYSVKQLKAYGAINVFSKPSFTPDTKFFDSLLDNPVLSWAHYSNEPLKNIIREKYWNDKEHPIKTKSEDVQPRLLVVSIDVETGTTVTFDSYPKIKEIDGNIVKDKGKPVLEWKTEYGDDKSITIEYPKGIKLDHVMASSSVPIHYDYTEIKSSTTKNSNDNSNTRYFWDGQYLSNTPLRELINAHQSYWVKKAEAEIGLEALHSKIVSVGEQNSQIVPNLDVYIANVWPTKETPVPQDHDGQLNRKNDIMFHDKTKYEEKVANLVNDYADLAIKLIDIVKNNPVNEKKQKEIENNLRVLLSKPGKSKSRGDKPRKYLELLTGEFTIEKIMRVELTNNENDKKDSISDKWADYSKRTISSLLEQGKRDAFKMLVGNLIKIVDSLQEPNTSMYPSDEIINKLNTHLKDTDELLKVYEPLNYDFIVGRLWAFIDLVKELESKGEKMGLTPRQASLLLP